MSSSFKVDAEPSGMEEHVKRQQLPSVHKEVSYLHSYSKHRFLHAHKYNYFHPHIIEF